MFHGQEAVIQTPSVKSFLLRPQHWRPFFAGQHLDVRLTASDAQRSYSVASAPGLDGFYELVVERLENGEIPLLA